MKSLNTWALPVSVSLLLHAGFLALVTYKFPATNPATNQPHAITVELTHTDSTPANKLRPQTLTPKLIKKPVQDDDKNRVPIVLSPAADVAQTPPANPVEMRTDNQPAIESQQSRSIIQPISKLTRLPSFLQKIEPVYPRTEQRAGSQANVLAEVTIDEKGIVQGVKIIKSAGVTFDNAVIEALTKSIFVPGYIGKEAVAVSVLVPIRFNLR